MRHNLYNVAQKYFFFHFLSKLLKNLKPRKNVEPDMMIKIGNKSAVVSAFRLGSSACSVRMYSGVTAEQEAGLSQREIRERAIAEAIAREEEAAARTKALREMKENTRVLINELNNMPVSSIRSRLDTLQKDLSKIDNQEKIKQLDEELEEFMLEQMKIPHYEISNRPWSAESNIRETGQDTEAQDEVSRSIQSTTASNSLTAKFPALRPTPDYRPYSEQELFLRQLNYARNSGDLGSKVTKVYTPRDEVKSPKTVNEINISSLLAAGCHLGHSKAMWRPSTQPFIYGEYDNIHLIDLNETLSALKRATTIIKGVSSKGGVILYVGTLKNWEQHRALEEAAKRSHGYYVSKRWIPGTITNFTEVTKQMEKDDRIEIDMLDEPTERPVDHSLSEKIIKPDLVVIMNPVENRNCITECIKLRIPTIGLCDTDMEPSLLTYPIPCNDDSLRVSSFMLGILSKAAEEGLQIRLEAFREYKSKLSQPGFNANSENIRKNISKA